jgi:prepilin-type N-terminal cleavage/methylation domain-containing protein
MPTLLRRRRKSVDAGFTLVELMVSMIVFAIILGIITTAIVAMLHQEQRQTGQADNLDASRKVIEMLDHSLRYANGVSQPGTGTDGSYYVEWQSGNTNQTQTCTQWRYVPTGGKLQQRTWTVPAVGGTVTAGAWATEAVGMSPVNSSTPIFSLSTTSSNTKEEVDVAFTATNGAPSTSSASQISLTAINSTTPTAPTGVNAICTQVGRP